MRIGKVGAEMRYSEDAMKVASLIFDGEIAWRDIRATLSVLDWDPRRALMAHNEIAPLVDTDTGRLNRDGLDMLRSGLRRVGKEPLPSDGGPWTHSWKDPFWKSRATLLGTSHYHGRFWHKHRGPMPHAHDPKNQVDHAPYGIPSRSVQVYCRYRRRVWLNRLAIAIVLVVAINFCSGAYNQSPYERCQEIAKARNPDTPFIRSTATFRDCMRDS